MKKKIEKKKEIVNKKFLVEITKTKTSLIDWIMINFSTSRNTYLLSLRKIFIEFAWIFFEFQIPDFAGDAFRFCIDPNFES